MGLEVITYLDDENPNFLQNSITIEKNLLNNKDFTQILINKLINDESFFIDIWEILIIDLNKLPILKEILIKKPIYLKLINKKYYSILKKFFTDFDIINIYKNYPINYLDTLINWLILNIDESFILNHYVMLSVPKHNSNNFIIWRKIITRFIIQFYLINNFNMLKSIIRTLQIHNNNNVYINAFEYNSFKFDNLDAELIGILTDESGLFNSTIINFIKDKLNSPIINKIFINDLIITLKKEKKFDKLSTLFINL